MRVGRAWRRKRKPSIVAHLGRSRGTNQRDTSSPYRKGVDLLNWHCICCCFSAASVCSMGASRAAGHSRITWPEVPSAPPDPARAPRIARGHHAPRRLTTQSGGVATFASHHRCGLRCERRPRTRRPRHRDRPLSATRPTASRPGRAPTGRARRRETVADIRRRFGSGLCVASRWSGVCFRNSFSGGHCGGL